MRDDRFGDKCDKYDARVLSRLEPGGGILAADYVQAMSDRSKLTGELSAALRGFDAWLAPTLPCVPPEIAPLEASDAAYFAAGARMGRNTAVVNLHDGCAVTIPCHAAGSAPVGLMIAGMSGADGTILACARAAESLISKGSPAFANESRHA